MRWTFPKSQVTTQRAVEVISGKGYTHKVLSLSDNEKKELVHLFIHSTNVVLSACQ
jgi:hypothetical protein